MTRSAVLNGPSLQRQRKDVTGTKTQSSSPVIGASKMIKPLYFYSVTVFLFLIVRQTNTENVPNSLQN